MFQLSAQQPMSLNLTESSRLNLGLDVISSPSETPLKVCVCSQCCYRVYPIPEWLSMHGADLMQVPSLGFKLMTYKNVYNSCALKSCSVLRVAIFFLSLPYHIH